MSENAAKLAELFIEAGNSYVPSDRVKVFHEIGSEIEEYDFFESDEESGADISNKLLEKAKKAYPNGVYGVKSFIDEEAYSRECSSCEVYEYHIPAWVGVAVAAASEEDITQELTLLEGWMQEMGKKKAMEALRDFAYDYANSLTDEEVLAELTKQRVKA